MTSQKKNLITDNGRSTKGTAKTREFIILFPSFGLIIDKIKQVEKSSQKLISMMSQASFCFWFFITLRLQIIEKKGTFSANYTNVQGSYLGGMLWFVR